MSGVETGRPDTGGWWSDDASYRLLVDTVHDYGILMLDPDGVIKTWNSGAERIKGYTAEEAIGQNFSMFYTQEDLDAGLPAHELEIAQQSGRFEAEGWRICRDGSRFWASMVLTALRDAEGTLLGYSKVTRDLTEREEQQRLVRQAAAYSRSLIEAALDALVTISPDGKITDVNGATERITGLTRDELVGTDFCDYFTAPQEARAGYEQVFRDGQVVDYPLELRHALGHVTPVLYNAAVYRDETGEVIGVLAVARDISERKLAEDRIRQQSRDILELSTPVMQIWDGIVAVPLIGSLDSQRTQMFMETLLDRIVETNSPMALVDITGVPTIDTQTAQHLIEAITAVRLLGAEVVLTGVRPVIAQTLVHLGVDLSGITTRASMAAGFKVALEALSLKVVDRDSGVPRS